MKDLVLIKPYCSEVCKTERLNEVLEECLAGYTYDFITNIEELEAAKLQGRRVIFAISLGKSGINLSWFEMMKYFRKNPGILEGSVGGVILDGECELYTKSMGRSIVFTANRAGCRFPGGSLAEGTRTLKNYNIRAANLGVDNAMAYKTSAKNLVQRVMEYEPDRKKHPNILVVHSSAGEKSNSLALWKMIKEDLSDCDIHEISLRNGELADCQGCSFEICRHFGEAGKCFFGGPMVEKVYPAILECDALVLVCANYNDAMAATLTAFVNRLTALYNTHRFYDKQLYGIIVSGYSGGDILSEQLIAGLNMNKTFALPGRFSIMETANSPLEILESEGITERAKEFSQNLRKHLIDE